MNHLIDILQLSTQEIDELVEKKFEGSLPTFIAAFTSTSIFSLLKVVSCQQTIDDRNLTYCIKACNSVGHTLADVIKMRCLASDNTS